MGDIAPGVSSFTFTNDNGRRIVSINGVSTNTEKCTDRDDRVFIDYKDE